MSASVQKTQLGDLSVLMIPGDSKGPVIVLLHGFGADAYDLVSLKEGLSLSPRPTWIFPYAPLPITIGSGIVGRAWFPIDFDALQHLIEEGRFEDLMHIFTSQLTLPRAMIASSLQALNIPRSQIVLGGFSQGAMMAVDTALHGQESCAALAIFSGMTASASEWTHLAPLHKTTRFFQSHGNQDPLLPLILAQHLEHMLIQGGLQGHLRIFTGGHTIAPTILSQFHHFLRELYVLE